MSREEGCAIGGGKFEPDMRKTDVPRGGTKNGGTLRGGRLTRETVNGTGD